jgi:hypothetical protein
VIVDRRGDLRHGGAVGAEREHSVQTGSQVLARDLRSNEDDILIAPHERALMRELRADGGVEVLQDPATVRLCEAGTRQAEATLDPLEEVTEAFLTAVSARHAGSVGAEPV